MNGPVWDDHPAPVTLAPVDRPVTADAVVVGLGASGLAALDELHRGGIGSLVGIDGATIGGGAAGRNGGLLLGGLALFHHRAVAALGRDRARAAYLATVQEIDRAARRGPDLVRRTGSLRVAATDDELDDCEAHLAALVADGIAATAYEGPEGRGLVLPDDAVVQPLARCRRQARDLLAAGVRLHEHTVARHLAPGRVVTDGGLIEADHVVVCVDGGLEALVPALGGRVRTARLQMAATAPAGDVVVPMPVYWRWGYDYWQQLPDGRLAVGGGRDRHEAQEWGAPAEPTEPVQDHLDDLLRRVIGTRAAVTHRWAGRSAYTGDRLPVIELAQPGLAVAGGYSGHGNVIGPLAGRAAVELALTGRSEMAQLLAGQPSVA